MFRKLNFYDPAFYAENSDLQNSNCLKTLRLASGIAEAIFPRGRAAFSFLQRLSLLIQFPNDHTPGSLGFSI